ncbi:hypothetical protein ACFLTU_05780 [Bacteroidota bacterium]
MRATEMMEKKLHFSLSLTEKGRLKMHKMMCDACRRYEKQNLFIENNLKHQNYIPQKEVDVVQLKKLINEKLVK